MASLKTNQMRSEPRYRYSLYIQILRTPYSTQKVKMEDANQNGAIFVLFSPGSFYSAPLPTYSPPKESI